MRTAPWICVFACACSSAPPPRASESELGPKRATCGFRAGAYPRETLGREVPIGREIPVDHVVLLMQENRSFDHYFGRLAARGLPEVEAPAPDASNPDANGVPVARYRETNYCNDDTAHGWSPSHRQYNDGAMDGFVVTSGSAGRVAMGYYDEEDLPFYYALARTFAIGDRFFCSLLGPTLPNRMFFLAGSSFGLKTNTVAPWDAPNVFESLSAAGIPWKVYHHRTPSAAIFVRTATANIERFRLFEEFLVDAAAGTLPPFSFVEPQYTGGGGARTDEHPPGNVQLGQALAALVVNALIRSPLWPRLVLFLTYDEHGGYYDHVPPPPACTPGGIVSEVPGATAPLSEFNRLGFRVPFFVVSPYARRGFVTHRTYDHTSVLRFVEALFGLPALSDRTANAAPPYDVFDFQRPPNLAPPPLPEATVDPGRLADCMARYPTGGGL